MYKSITPLATNESLSVCVSTWCEGNSLQNQVSSLADDAVHRVWHSRVYISESMASSILFSVFGVVCTTACSASCERVFIHKLIKDWFILAHFLQLNWSSTPCLWDGVLVLWCSRLIIMSMLWALEYVDIFTPVWRFSIPVWDCGSSLVPQILNVWAITSL